MGEQRRRYVNGCWTEMPARVRSLSLALTVFGITALSACTLASQQESKDLGQYFSTVEGFTKWQQKQTALAEQVDTTKMTYETQKSMDALSAYYRRLLEYLDHGFLLVRSYDAINVPVPKTLTRSLEDATNALMDIAVQYLQQGSIPMAEGIAREVIVKYSGTGRMTTAQRRAEALMLRYPYRQDY